MRKMTCEVYLSTVFDLSHECSRVDQSQVLKMCTEVITTWPEKEEETCVTDARAHLRRSANAQQHWHETLQFPQNWFKTNYESNCCSRETLLHDRTFSTRVWLQQFRYVKSTRPFRLRVAALFEFLTPAQHIQTLQTPFVRVVTHVSFIAAYVHPSQSTQLTNPISR